MPAVATTRILFVGDMHLGRLPSGLPGDLRHDSDVGPAAAWRRTVDAALEHEVRAVALAGDLVHSPTAAFGAYGPLTDGIDRLAAAGIPVCAVAGNHDAATLPHMAGRIEGLTLLGQDGRWSTFDVDSGPGPTVRLVGWSFPRTRHDQSPFVVPPPRPVPESVTFGLLHCDLGATRSPYAPVSAAELLAAGFDGWFLGHEHVAGVPGTGEPFYLGSLTPLDPSEIGLHGPVLVTVSPGGGAPLVERLPLAPVRWEKLDLPVPADALAEQDLRHLLYSAAVSHLETIVARQQELRILGLRVTLTGRVKDPDAWDRAVRALDPAELVVDRDPVRIIIDRIEPRLRIDRDLTELAGNSDPAGLLARRILVLENDGRPVPGVPDPTGDAERLVAAARTCRENVDRRPFFVGLSADSADRSEAEVVRAAREDLIRVARRLLDRLLIRKGADRAAD